MEMLAEADWVIAPDIFISESTNVFWKYYQFDELPMEICETTLERTIGLIDSFIDAKLLYKEAFSLACLLNHPVYDMLFLVLARRHNGCLLTMDKHLRKSALKHSIKVEKDESS